MNTRRLFSLIAYLIAAIVVAYFVAEQYGPKLEIGQQAPLQTTLKLLNGQKRSFSFYAQRYLVVNFWATWCEPCREEIPILVRLAQKYKGRINFVGPTVDSAKDQVISTVQEFNIPYPVGTVDLSALEFWQAHTLPTTYLLNTSGQILWAKSGILSEQALDEAIAHVLK